LRTPGRIAIRSSACCCGVAGTPGERFR
jgi:hypothetical protein